LDTKASGQTKIHHPGTFNANPLSAAAGVAMLSSIADGEAQRAVVTMQCRGDGW
jgi:glutamate-1-semialdehyde aminotransferase